MTSTTKSRLARLAVCGLLAAAGPRAAFAQSGTTAPPSPVTVLPRAGFYFQYGPLVSSDPRFSWDGMMGIDVDLVAYPRGRVNFAADYEAVLGEVTRPFELNHENFSLDGSASYEWPRVTLLAAFHHVSRHLSDLPNSSVIAWNVLDFRASRRFTAGRAIVDAEIDAGRVLQHTFVDYAWTADLRLRLRRPVSERLSLFAGGVGELVGVDEERYGRGGQCGAKLEAGVRWAGRAAALELFAGYERRVDGFPTEHTRVRAFTFGFRITNRH